MMFIIITIPDTRNHGHEEAFEVIMDITSPKFTLRNVNHRQPRLIRMRMERIANRFIEWRKTLSLHAQ